MQGADINVSRETLHVWPGQVGANRLRQWHIMMKRGSEPSGVLLLKIFLFYVQFNLLELAWIAAKMNVENG
jgi:hypothetical protein